MPITHTQLAKRNTRIGSSDLAAIMGLDPFRNAYDVWLQKTDKLEAEKAVKDGVAFFGTIFEDGLLDHFAKDVGKKILRNQFRTAKYFGFPLGSNIDALIVETGEPVEAKTSGLLGPLFETWGESMTDEIPDRVIVQCHSHMICTEKDVCHVPVFLGGRGYLRYIVNLDEQIADTLLEAGHKFWNNHVLADIPPENLIPNLNLVKRLKKVPETVVDLDIGVVAEWDAARAARLAAEKAEKERLAAVLAALGEAEAGNCGEMGTLTYFETSRAGHEVKPSTFRTLRLVKPKAEKKAKAATEVQ